MIQIKIAPAINRAFDAFSIFLFLLFFSFDYFLLKYLVYYTGDGDNSEANVSEATQSMTKLKSKINSSKRYEVTTTESEGVIHTVQITESGATASPSPSTTTLI